MAVGGGAFCGGSGVRRACASRGLSTHVARALHPCPLSQSQPALLGLLANSIAVGDPPSPSRGADTSVFCDPPGPLPLFDISWSSALRHRDSFARPLGNPPVTQAGVNLCEAEAWGVPAAVREEWRSGACLLRTGLPKPFYRPNYSSVTENVSAVRTELARLASLSKITPWRGPGRRPRVVSPMGVVLKDGKTRMIVHMTASGVNANLHNPHFSMPSVETALNTIRPGDWLGKIDLTDAFLTFPLREDDRTLFGIQDPDTGLFWTYTCLPFGNSNSPYKYVTFSSYLLAALARCGLDELICFMDDHAIRGSSAFECELRMWVLLRFFRRMNIPVKHSKTLWPSRRMDFLGIIFDTVACTLELTPAKLASLRALVSSALVHYTSRTPVSGTFWQSLTGKLSFAGSVVRAGRTYVRRLWDLGSALVGKRRRGLCLVLFAHLSNRRGGPPLVAHGPGHPHGGSPMDSFESRIFLPLAPRLHAALPGRPDTDGRLRLRLGLSLWLGIPPRSLDAGPSPHVQKLERFNDCPDRLPVVRPLLGWQAGALGI